MTGCGIGTFDASHQREMMRTLGSVMLTASRVPVCVRAVMHVEGRKYQAVLERIDLVSEFAWLHGGHRN